MSDCNHMNPQNWHELPAPKRLGDARKWRQTFCRQCGQWLGYRLADKDAAKEEAHAALVGKYDRDP